ncbi:hypothetical protein DL96DRAFT_1609283 [Flagelloscypha sp. PMI_526]|nr:hypothetical protein DL96DRAFT_1609283 [Flagelloscypha sp. PMI_526]
MASTPIEPLSADTRAALRHAVNAVVAPYELGLLFSMLLFGGVTFTARSYFHAFKDRVYVRILVVFIWVIMLAHIVFGVVAVHDMTVVHYGDYATLIYYPKFINVNLVLSGILSVTTQSFFAYSLWRLSECIIIPLICWTIAAARLSTVIAMAVLSMVVPEVEQTVQIFKERHHWLIVATMILSVTVDVLVTTSLIYFLWIKKNSGVFEKTRKIVDKLILWTLQTGLLTSVITIAMVVTYLTMENFVWLALFYTNACMFAVSLLASLKARKTTVKALCTSVDGSVRIASLPTSSNRGITRRMTVTVNSRRLTVPLDPEKALGSTEKMEAEPGH